MLFNIGKQWGVVIDRPGSLVVDHIHPRNSFNFSLTRSYVEPPHGFIVRFQDASNDFKEAKRVVPWPGFTGEPTILETLELPGNTDATSVFREATRRALEVKYRPDVYEVTQATRGDTVRVTYDVLDSIHRSARVVSVSGNMIKLDELIEMEEGKDYGLRFRVFTPTTEGQPPDTIGTSVVRTLLTQPGESPVVTVTGEGQMPEEGAWVLFGEAGTESFLAVVTSVEATEDMCSILRLVDAAPEIDEEGHEPILTPDDDDDSPADAADEPGMGSTDGDDDDLGDDDDDSVPFIEDEDDNDLDDEIAKPSRDDDD